MATLAPMIKSQSVPTTEQGVKAGFDWLSSASSQLLPYPMISVNIISSHLDQRLTALEEKVDSLCELINSRPITYNTHLIDLNDPRLQLRCPLAVVIESYTDEVIATIPEFNLYASGSSDAVALAKLKLEVVSSYVRLIELGSEQLGPLARGCLAAMNRVIEMNNA